MSLEKKFQEAADSVRTLTKRPKNEELLEIYAFYKQATVGDCNLGRPSGVDLQAVQKWDAWNSKRGLDCATAKQEYIRKANELQALYL